MPSQPMPGRTFRDSNREREGIVILVNELPVVLKPAFAQSGALRDELRYVLSQYLEYDPGEPVNVRILSYPNRRCTQIAVSYDSEFFNAQEATMRAKKLSSMRHDLMLAMKNVLPGFRFRRSLVIGGLTGCVVFSAAALLWMRGFPLNPLLIIGGLGWVGVFLLHWGLYEPMRIYRGSA